MNQAYLNELSFGIWRELFSAMKIKQAVSESQKTNIENCLVKPHFKSPEDLPNSGIEPTSLTSLGWKVLYH